MLTGSSPIGASPTAWGRLAAVRRTLEWVRLSPDRGLRAPYLGSNCGRLLDEAVAQLDPQAEVPAALREARRLLEALDGAGEGERQALLGQVVDALEQVLPLPQAGATLVALQPRARLVLPGRGRRGRREQEGEGPTAEAGAARERGGRPDGADAGEADEIERDEVEADEVAAVTWEEGAVSDRAQERDETGEEPGEVELDGGADEPDLEDLVAQARAGTRGEEGGRRERPPREDPGAGRLPFMHPERGEAPLSSIAGLDPELVAALESQGISTVADLLLLPPEDFDRRPQLRGPHDDGEGESSGTVVVRGGVHTRCTRLTPGLRRREVVLDLRDGQRVVARWIGAPPRGFHSWGPGAEIALVGAASWDEPGEGTPTLATPALATLYEAEVVGLDGRGSGWLATYGLEGIDDRDLRDAMARALAIVMGTVRDTLPPQVLEAHRLLPLDEALRDAHFPANTTRRGRTRLAFEELFLLQLGIALRAAAGRATRGAVHKALHGYLGQLELQHGLVLDDGQEQALAEIRRDLIQPRAMTRLLQGDVGAGKGLVALMAACIVAENRAQVAMICPDALSAERRFLFAEPLLRSLGVVPVLAGAGVSHAQADAIRRGEAHVVFGTQALVDDKVEWKRLGLVVVEERDRYGTLPPQALRARTPRPDLLVMTTAPIPASLALSIFGEFDLSVVPRRGAPMVTPRVCSGQERGQAYELVRTQVAAGHQAIVVFPVAGGRDLLGPDDALRFAEALRREFLPEARIAVYASAMARDDRFRVHDDFAHRRVDVLISTTFIEDTPPVDNATVMVVEHADKHSLVRLHRLRGHMRHGTCAFVLGDQPGEEGRRLVQLASEEADGFRLAELDLQARGVDELLGDRATEAPQFGWADPPEDRTLLLRARAEAFELARVDPELRRWRPLAQAVQARWGEWLGDETPSSSSPANRADRGGRRRRRRRRR